MTKSDPRVTANREKPKQEIPNGEPKGQNGNPGTVNIRSDSEPDGDTKSDTLSGWDGVVTLASDRENLVRG